MGVAPQRSLFLLGKMQGGRQDPHPPLLHLPTSFTQTFVLLSVLPAEESALVTMAPSTPGPAAPKEAHYFSQDLDRRVGDGGDE